MAAGVLPGPHCVARRKRSTARFQTRGLLFLAAAEIQESGRILSTHAAVENPPFAKRRFFARQSGAVNTVNTPV
jgi:hypothetical protein